MKFGGFGTADFTDVDLNDINIYFCINKYLFVLWGTGSTKHFGCVLVGWLCWFCVPGAFVDVAYAYW